MKLKFAVALFALTFSTSQASTRRVFYIKAHPESENRDIYLKVIEHAKSLQNIYHVTLTHKQYNDQQQKIKTHF